MELRHIAEQSRRGSLRRRGVGLLLAGVMMTLAHAAAALAALPARIAVYRTTTGEWIVRGDDGQPTRIKYGIPGDLPVPADYDGFQRAQIAVFRPSTAEFFIRQDDGTTQRVPFGLPGDVPVPGDYLGIGRSQIAVYRPLTGQWFIRNDDGSSSWVQWGLAIDTPVPGNYAGDGRTRFAVYRQSAGEWFVRNDNGTSPRILFGTPGDLAVPGAYGMDGKTRIAVYRPSNQVWFLRQDDGSPMGIAWGMPGDVPAPADYDGSGRTRIAVFRPGSGLWVIRKDDGTASTIQWGDPGDVPVPAAFPATFQPSPPDRTAPTTLTTSSPAPNTLGWNNTDVTVTLSAAPSPGNLSGIRDITFTAAGAQPMAQQTVAGAFVTLRFTVEGATQLSFFARDIAGNVEPTRTLVVRVDKTAPVIRTTRTPAANVDGWNNSAVTVNFTATDTISGIDGSAAGTETLNQEGKGQSSTLAFFDRAGNSATATVKDIHIDKTLPTLTFGTATPAPNAAGWNNTDVSVLFTASDSLSGVSVTAPATSPLIVTAQGATATGNVVVTDKAGNSATFTSPAFKIDKTPPTLTAVRTPVPNAAGWHRTDVTLTFAATDALSGVDDTSDPVVLNKEGIDQTATGTATDKAGNKGTLTVQGIKIDKTPPTLTFGAATPAPNAAGWNNTDVSVPFTASDSLSGVATTAPATSPLLITAQGAAVTGNVQVSDQAGNVTTATTTAFKIDKTPPVLSAARSAPATSFGWHNTDVTITFTAVDALSGVESNAEPVKLTQEGTDQSATGTAKDKAGNTATLAVRGINIDKTAPTLTFGTIAPAPNAAGWNNTDVTVPFTAADSLSGLSVTNPAVSPLVIQAQGPNVTGTVSVTDKAGNAITFSTPVLKIDKTPPSLVGTRGPAPNAAGWNNSDVTVTFTATDPISGVASNPAPVVLNKEGVDQSASATATDLAGNSTTITTSGIKIDKTPPTLTFGTPSPAANENGWRATNVSVPFTTADALSGVATTTPSASPLLVSTEGVATTGTATVTDAAGNAATFTTATFSIDKTLPVITFTGNAGTYVVDQTIRITFAATDALSGIASHTGSDIIAPAYSYGLGFHPISATAKDKAGNQRISGTSFNVQVTFDSLNALTQQFITAPAVVTYLSAPLTSAKLAASRNQTAQKDAAMADYITRVNEQRGLFLTPVQADTLITFARAL